MGEAGIHDEPGRADESTDDESLSVSNSRAFTRQELKQLDRELPWKEVIKLPQPDQLKYQVIVEHDNWMRWGGLRPL